MFSTSSFQIYLVSVSAYFNLRIYMTTQEMLQCFCKKVELFMLRSKKKTMKTIGPNEDICHRVRLQWDKVENSTPIVCQLCSKQIQNFKVKID